MSTVHAEGGMCMLKEELCRAGGLSSAEAVVKWLEVHPYLHSDHPDSTGAAAHVTVQHPLFDAGQEFARLKPLIQAAVDGQ